MAISRQVTIHEGPGGSFESMWVGDAEVGAKPGILFLPNILGTKEWDRAQRNALIERIVDGAGTASRGERRAAFENVGLAEPLKTLIQKVATQATAVMDRDRSSALRSRPIELPAR